MSLFLVYFEAGKSVFSSDSLSPLVAIPLIVTDQEEDGARRPAIAITDGVASDHFLRFGNRVADRQGEAMRKTLFTFLRQRLDAGARPHLVFVVFDGPVSLFSVRGHNGVEVPMSALEARFRSLQPLQVVAVVSD